MFDLLLTTDPERGGNDILFTGGGPDVAFGGSGDDADVIAGFASTYLRISVFGLPAMLVMLAAVGYLRGLQDTVRPLIVAVATAVANIRSATQRTVFGVSLSKMLSRRWAWYS